MALQFLASESQQTGVMKERLVKLAGNPILTSILGWLFFLAMYLLIGVASALGGSMNTAFAVSAPAGVIGFGCWVGASVLSLLRLAKWENPAVALGGLVLSAIPLSLLGIAWWAAINGGV